MKILCVEPKELKEVVIKRIHARKINLSKLAEEIGENRQMALDIVREISKKYL